MTKKLSVAAIAAALLMSGGLVGVSFGGGAGIIEPEVIELSVDICGHEGPCRYFFLTDSGETQTGQITLTKNPLFDVDGNEVGHMNISCVASSRPSGKGQTDWICTYVLTLKAGSHTDQGTVVASGIYASPADPDVFAVTGGTGAYVNVRGYATHEDGPGQDPFTLHLIP